MIKILIKNYSYQNKIPVLREINFSILPTQITTFIGPSGIGKSTLLRLLTGIETGAEGFITDENQTYCLKTSWHSHQNIFSLVTQTPQLFPWKNILENMTLAMDSFKNKLSKNEKKALAMHLLCLVQMENHAQKYPYEISLGMAQRVSFARALIHESKVLLLDEPFASLDAHTRFLLQKWLVDKIQKTQKYAILVTHDVREALFLSQKIHVLGHTPAHIVKSYCQKESPSWHSKKTEEEIISLLDQNKLNEKFF
jgi:ABC-type nitrate/sulfonate/bicarbonate transport system ATPase subunit